MANDNVIDHKVGRNIDPSGNVRNSTCDANGNHLVSSIPGGASAANVLNGYFNATATTGVTTLITVGAGRTWVGSVAMSCGCEEDAAGTVAPFASAFLASAGTNVTPAAGTIMKLRAMGAANAAGGTVGNSANVTIVLPVVVIAPAGNSVTLTIQTSQGGTASEVNVAALGQLL